MPDSLTKNVCISPRPATKTVPFRGTVAIETHGCKLNQADSNLLARQFVETGYRLVDSVTEADVYVLNTCTVTATADAKARQALNAARRSNPNATIVAAGCYPQRAAEELARLEAVSVVVPNTDKHALVSLVTAAREQSTAHENVESGNASGQHAIYLPDRLSFQRSRAMVKIQEGCNQVCAYCIVPKVRGRERSIPPESLVQQIKQYVAEGYREVVLTGTQLGTYGFDIPGVSLPELLHRILNETSVPRLRVSSLQPQEIGRELLGLWSDTRLCPHFHIPLQSGSDGVLKTMRRRYDTKTFARVVEMVRSALPDAGVTADLIVGFPGEGEKEFQESQAFVRSMSFSDMHIFPYSQRPSTSAAYFKDQVSAPVKKERVAEMMDLARQDFLAFRLRQLGTARAVLWESPRERDGVTVWSGLTDNYIRVYTNREQLLRGTITKSRLTSVEGSWVYAQPLSSQF
jgi:threonylcarbamoyladenosine tRNA methylthiotransferase MtaB